MSAQHAASKRWDSVIEEWLHTNQAPVKSTGSIFNVTPSLVTSSLPLNFTLGTGYDIVSSTSNHIASLVASEIIFVTCFWAKSTSLSRLSNLLRALSQKAHAAGTKIRVRICFSSLSATQKILHTSSPHGHTYAPHEWARKLGLPAPESVPGLDVQVKSIFVRPFSVMHPKFVIVDRSTVFLPSCNVSWEDWFEGCIAMRGAVAGQFVRFYEEFWTVGDGSHRYTDFASEDTAPTVHEHLDGSATSTSTAAFSLNGTNNQQTSTAALPLTTTLSTSATPVKTIFLPHSHARNPHFHPFPCQSPPQPPRTPLNTFTLALLSNARHSIFMQTPNLTSPPVLAALHAAHERGVRLHIVTNQRLMTLEQLVTAGTTTPRCVDRLLRRSHTARKAPIGARPGEGADWMDGDVEAGHRPSATGVKQGHIRVEWFAELQARKWAEAGERQGLAKAHLKLTIVDDEVVVLGSGNMDRASWYTSQELGVAFVSVELAQSIGRMVKAAVGCHSS